MSLTKKGEIAIIQICRSDVSQPSPKSIFTKIFQTKTSIQMSKLKNELFLYFYFILCQKYLLQFSNKIIRSMTKKDFQNYTMEPK